MIEEIVRLITNAAPGIDKDLERILELIYQYAKEAERDAYALARKHYEY